MKIGDKVLCIAPKGKLWKDYNNNINSGPKFEDELIIYEIDYIGYLFFKEYGYKNCYNPEYFIIIEPKNKLIIKLESKKIIEEINIIQN